MSITYSIVAPYLSLLYVLEEPMVNNDFASLLVFNIGLHRIFHALWYGFQNRAVTYDVTFISSCGFYDLCYHLEGSYRN